MAPLRDGNELKIVIEVKGLVRPTDPEKAPLDPRHTGYPPVNNHTAFSENGPWTYLYIDDEPSKTHAADAISEAIAAHQRSR